MAALATDQSIMRRLQSQAVSRIVCLLGIRWASSVQRGTISPVVQSIVVASRLGGINSVEEYRDKKHAGLKGDFYVLQQMQQTQNKTAKQHCETTRQLIMPFFEESSDPMVDYIKKTLFNVNTPARDAPWGPIVPPENPIMEAMMALPRPSVNGVHPAIPVRSTSRRRTARVAPRAAVRRSPRAARRHYAQRAACIDARRARGNARTVTRAARGAQ